MDVIIICSQFVCFFFYFGLCQFYVLNWPLSVLRYQKEENTLNLHQLVFRMTTLDLKAFQRIRYFFNIDFHGQFV